MSVVKRVNLIDLFELPFSIVHELYRDAFMTMQEMKRKQKEEEEQQRIEEARNRNKLPTANQRSTPPIPSMSGPPLNEDDLEEFLEEVT